MNEPPEPPLAEVLTREHRRLDELFGRFLGAAAAGDVAESRRAMEEFDKELRGHTAFEEEMVLAAPTGHKLAPSEAESENQQLSRELRLEHVQIRELSAMILRQLAATPPDAAAAQALAGNLARRWDAHTTREEREVFEPRQD